MWTNVPDQLECPRGIHIEYKLDVIGTDKIVVPGCEPTSALTSTTLARWGDCGSVTVDVADALEAIPGSKLEYQINTGGVRKRWFVLPAYCPICRPGCLSIPDYYQILKDLANEGQDEEEPEQCEGEVLDQGFCKDPSRMDPVVKRGDPYRQEGNVFGMTPQLFNTPRDFSQPDLSDSDGNPYLDQ